MQTKVLSREFITGAITAPEGCFVSIGQGLEVFVPNGAKSGDEWVIEIKPYKTPVHLAHTQQGRELFVTSERQLLAQINNNLVIFQNDTKQVVNLPNRPPQAQLDHRSNQLVSYFNHLFLVKGRTLWWTDLDNPWEWIPHPHNEADFRKIEWQTQDATGLVQSADKLYLHFPSAIYEIVYVGKPTLVHIVEKVRGLGSVTPRSLVVHNSIQFFMGTDNFYAYSSETGLSAIGQDVWKKFLQLRGPIESTWAYVDQRNNEICWVSGDYMWAFNFLEKHWQKYSAEGIKAQATSAWTLRPSELNESLSIIEPDYPDGLENLWVSDGAVMRESRMTDAPEKCVRLQSPMLESDDITYGDLHFVKRCDLMMLDARTEWPWVGFEVWVSGKDYVTHPNAWVFCGLWTQRNRMKQTDFRAVAGKVLKFKFVLRDGFGWNGLLPNGGLSLNGKNLDIANGQIIMDGSRKDFLGRQFICPDGTRTIGELGGELIGSPEVTSRMGFAELNAWGERVDLPQILIGPDK